MILGAGTAMVYPTLLAAIGDVAHPVWRGRAVGVYRVWRDLGYAVGAVFGAFVMAPYARAPRRVLRGIALAVAAAASKPLLALPRTSQRAP